MSSRRVLASVAFAMLAGPVARPGLFAAIQEQLGLRLEGRRGPLDVVVVTAASRTPAAT